MSFRNRLTLFFVLIVIVPMVSVAFVLFRLIADNESGKADARLAAAKRLGDQPLPRGRSRGRPARAARSARDVRAGQALRDERRRRRSRRALDELLRQRGRCAGS